MDIKTFYSKIFNVFKKEVDTGVKQFKDWQQNQARPSQPAQPQAAQPQPAQPQQPVYDQPERNDAEWMAYFREILASEFSQYEIRENVPVPELVGYVSDEFKLYKDRPQQAYKAEWGKPYTFVLFNNGLVYGVVMLGSGHCHDSNVKYLISRMYTKKMNVPYINFYTQMPNERGYVIDRIKRLMRLN